LELWRIVLQAITDIIFQRDYDISHPTPPEDAYAFYRSYVAESKGHILEPMCGTGRFLLPLISEGFDIHGFDASQHMLNALHTKAKLQNVKPTVWVDFVENLNRSERYSLIFIPTGSFGLITDPHAIEKSLKILYTHLADDGILLFEAETIKSMPPIGIWHG
jgi:SAM-dependent methyltransferase